MNAEPAPARSRRRDAAIASQRGMSTIALLAVLGVAVFVGLFAIKVGPAYFENMTIDKIVEDKASDARLMKAPRSKVYAALNQAYRMNNLWDMKAEDTVTLKRDGKHGYTMTVQYEKRANLFGNIDLVTVFGGDEGETSL